MPNPFMLLAILIYSAPFILLIIFLVKGIKYFSKKDTDPTDKDRP